MKHIKLHSTDFLEIEYNVVDDILVGNWSGPLTDEAIINGYEHIGFFLKKQFCPRLLDNHMEVRGLWADLSGWVAHNWHPEAERQGLQYHAFVYSKDTFSRLSTEKTVQLVEKGVVSGFETVPAAEGWLRGLY